MSFKKKKCCNNVVMLSAGVSLGLLIKVVEEIFTVLTVVRTSKLVWWITRYKQKRLRDHIKFLCRSIKKFYMIAKTFLLISRDPPDQF